MQYSICLVVSEVISIYKTKIYKRYTVNFGFWLIAAAVSIYATEILILYLTTFIQGGGPTFVISYMLGYLAFALKIMLVVGAIKLLMSLKPLPDKSTS